MAKCDSLPAGIQRDDGFTPPRWLELCTLPQVLHLPLPSSLRCWVLGKVRFAKMCARRGGGGVDSRR